MGRIKRGIRLAKQSWGVVKADRSLLVFPVLSAVMIAIAMVAIWAPTVALGAFSGAESVNESNPAVIAVIVVSAYVSTFLAIFFNVALASCAARAFEGEPTSVSQGLAAARERSGQIAAWALLATTVGLVLRAIEERVPAAARIAVWLVGAAWAIATYLVVPVLAYERVGPFDALKRSASIVRRHWGESITGNVGIGIVTGLASVVVLAATGALAYAVAASLAAALVVAAIGALVVIAIWIVGSALTQVFNVAVYRYATEGPQATGPFAAADIEQAFRPKRGGPKTSTI